MTLSALLPSAFNSLLYQEPNFCDAIVYPVAAVRACVVLCALRYGKVFWCSRGLWLWLQCNGCVLLDMEKCSSVLVGSCNAMQCKGEKCHTEHES